VKVHLLSLDPHDDAVSACDKLGWAQATRVVLVWPKEGRPLTRRLDIVLIERRARSLGTQIGLVTVDPDVREHARELGIPVFGSPEEIRESGWRRRGRRIDRSIHRRRPRSETLTRPSPGAPRPLPAPTRALLFALPVMAILAVAATAFPSAVITISPATDRRADSFSFSLDPAVDQPRSDGRLPAQTVSATLHGEIRVTTTGRAAVDQTEAHGAVVLTNLTSGRVEIPAELGLRATGQGGARFVTLASVALEAGEEVTVDIAATTPGTAGNVPAEAIDAVEGPAAFLVEVTNPGPTTGGTASQRAAVAAADQSRALQQLTAQLIAQAADELQSRLNAGQRLAMASLRTVRVVQREYDREIGEPADSLHLVLELDVAAYAYRSDDLQQAGNLAAEGEAAGLALVPGSVEVALDGDFVEGSPGTYRATAVVRWAEYERPDLQSLPPLAGHSRTTAADRVRDALDLAAAPGIRISPPWMPWLPWLPSRITFQLPWEQG